MQTRNRLSPKTAKRTGVALFVVSCITLVATLTLPFVSLPVSGSVKAGLITVIAVSGELAFAASIGLLGKEYVNKIKAYISVSDAPFSSFFLGAGVVVWAVATVLLWFVGQYLPNAARLIPGNTPLTIAAFVGVAMLMVFLMNTLYRTKQVPGGERLLAATLFALPGMILDAGTVFFFADVFPNMPPEAGFLFAAWLFWGYSVVLITGLIRLKKPDERA